MAHPEGEAADAPMSVDQKAAEIEKFLFDGEEEADEEEDESEEGDSEELELDEDEEQEDEEVEPETAIDPPVSLNAEEKALFAQLPKAQQEAWSASENRRNSQVQEATTKASNAQRQAEARAAAADAEAKRIYAAQLDQFLMAYAPQEPDPMLAQQNPQAYIAQDAQYRAAKAQHDQIVQQVKALQSEADTEATQAFVQQRDRELMTIPEIANPETRSGYIDRIMEAATAMGYDPSELAEGMQLRDAKALAYVADLQEKASKYDKAMSKQMQKVRAAKGKTLRPNAAPQAQSRAVKTDKAWQRVKQSGGNKDAQASAMAEWLESSGHL